MREIKFRAWYKTDKKMLYEGYLPSKNEEGYYLSLSFDGKITVATNDDGGKSGLWEHECSGWGEDFILMQFTGLKDKNGKEIYEGDIIKNNCDNSIFEVVYLEDQAKFRWKRLSGIRNGEDTWHIILFNGEVIVNIYENPELLN
jgi:uncharacterized phage protein (TIGR01671 family)